MTNIDSFTNSVAIKLVHICCWADWAVLGNTETSAILPNYPYFEGGRGGGVLFSYENKFLKIDFLYIVASTLKS